MNNLQILGAVYGNCIIERYKLTPSTALVLIALCYHYDTEHNNAFPSQEFIANKTNLSKSSLVRAIKQLLQADLIIKTKNRFGNLYEFTDNFFNEVGYKPSCSKQIKNSVKGSSIIKDVQVDQVNYFLNHD